MKKGVSKEERKPMLRAIAEIKFGSAQADPKEFERYMLESQRKVYALALRLSGNSSDAEDLTQEAYIRAFRFFHRYDANQSFSSWMYRIVTNVHIDAVRRKGKLKWSSLDQPAANQVSWDVPDETNVPDRELMHETVDEALQMGLSRMTPEFRTAVVLADVEGMAYEEIAETMNTSVGTVRSRIHRGRKQLRSFLTRHFPDRYGLGEDVLS